VAKFLVNRCHTWEARCTLVLTKEQFIEGLKRAQAWSRRQQQTDREAQAASLASEKRARLAQD
jgi:hypothetical protein